MFSSRFKADYPWASLIMPGLVLAPLSLATIARLTRTSLMENLRADYVRTARAKGLQPGAVVGVHVLRNSLIPVVTFLGVDLGALMGGAIVTEGIFNIPGVGGSIVPGASAPGDASRGRLRHHAGVVFLVANLLVDLLYAVLDPRIRYE